MKTKISLLAVLISIGFNAYSQRTFLKRKYTKGIFHEEGFFKRGKVNKAEQAITFTKTNDTKTTKLNDTVHVNQKEVKDLPLENQQHNSIINNQALTSNNNQVVFNTTKHNKLYLDTNSLKASNLKNTRAIKIVVIKNFQKCQMNTWK